MTDSGFRPYVTATDAPVYPERLRHFAAASAYNEEPGSLPAKRFVIDGESVVLDEDCRSNFSRLMFGRTGTHVLAFDLLLLGRTDFRTYPLEIRKAALKDLLGSSGPVRYCDHVVGCGRAFFKLVREAGLEGMVAKRRSSPYLGALTDDWLKVKCLRLHEFVIGGWIPANRHSGRPVALLLGELFDGKLHYVAKVESGLDIRTLPPVWRDLGWLRTSPFHEPIGEPAARFCKPSVRIPIEFVDFTDTGYLRHAAISRNVLFPDQR